MQIANSITEATLDSILKGGVGHLNADLKEIGVEIIEHSIVPNGVNDRKTVQQFLRGIESHCLVLAIKRPDGTVIQHPACTYRSRRAIPSSCSRMVDWSRDAHS